MLIKIVQKASVQLSITLILKQHVFAIRIVSKVQFVILIFKMLSHVLEMAGVNKLGCINIYVNVVKVTTPTIPVWTFHLERSQFGGAKFH